MRWKFWSRGSNQVTRSEENAVILKDQDGKILKPWQVRAGMMMRATDYSHGAGTVVCIVGFPVGVRDIDGRIHHPVDLTFVFEDSDDA